MTEVLSFKKNRISFATRSRPQIVFKKILPVAPAVDHFEDVIIIDDVQIVEEQPKTNWSIMSAEGCAVRGLSYEEASNLMQQLSRENVPGLYLTTDESESQSVWF